MNNRLEKRLVTFAASIIFFSENLKKIEASRVLRSQIIRSGTSVALNYAESQNAESKRDFVHKVRISYKELRETNVNLLIIKEAKLYLNINQLDTLLRECGELLAIFTSILKTATQKT